MEKGWRDTKCVVTSRIDGRLDSGLVFLNTKCTQGPSKVDLVGRVTVKEGSTVIREDEHVPERPNLGVGYLLVARREDEVFQLIYFLYFLKPHPDGWRLWGFPFKRNACLGGIKEIAND